MVRRRPLRSGALALLAALASVPARADDDGKCRLVREDSLDMTFVPDGRVSVPMTIDGRPARMLVDTGGLISMLTPPMVAALGLFPHIIENARIEQYGGLLVDHYVTVDDIMLGRLQGRHHDFLVMPEHGYNSAMDGLLAPDILSSYDADFDFANAKLNLFSQDHCEGEVVYWTQNPFGVVEFHSNQFGQMSVPVELDGKSFRATIDTGAFSSVASLEGIEDAFDIDEKNPQLQRLPGERPRYRYPFKTLTFQSVTVYNPQIELVPDAQSKISFGTPKMLLGINVLRRLHLYIAYGERKLYVTPAEAH